MRARRVAILGGGPAGLAAALVLARSGHRVTVLERDEVPLGPSHDAPAWPRRGIPHYLQPHAFIPRGRLEVRRQLPDVYASMLANGAVDIDLLPKLRAPALPGDEELGYLGVRRPLIEWALRSTVAVERGIELRAGVDVRGLRFDGSAVTGVVTDEGVVDTDLAVDATGRRTKVPTWLADAGHATPEPKTSDCGVVYYSRYYRVRDGVELPDGPWLLSPRGDVGYLAYATFPGDNRTFGGLLAVPNGVPDWRALREPAVFEAAVATIPALRMWIDPDAVEPITDVLPMAGLRNSIREIDESYSARRVVPIGDALSHTDPVLAHGLAFALVHAAALRDALEDHDDVGDAIAAYAGSVLPAVRERFAFATALDEQRRRMWVGGPVDFTRAHGDYALFSMAAAGAVALTDPTVCRMFLRRIGLLDSTTVLDNDVAMQEHIERTFAAMLSVPRPASGPPLEEMRSLVSAHGF